MIKHDSQNSFEKAIDVLQRKGPIGRALKLTDTITELAAAQAFAEALPCNNPDILCQRASNMMSGGIEMYYPFVEQFIKLGYLKQLNGELRATEDLFEFIDYSTYRVGVALQLLNVTTKRFVTQKVNGALKQGGKRFAVWGINAFADSVWAELIKNNAEVICFIDRHSILYPNGYCGLPVMMFEEVCEEYGDVIDTIIICSRAGGAAMCAKAENRFRCVQLFTLPAQRSHEVSGGTQLPPVLGISVPKSGTHLLQNILGNLPGMRFRAGMQVLDQSVNRLEQLLDCLGPGDFAMDHIPWTPEAAALLVNRNIRVLFLIRDPRDILVSLMNYYLYHEVNHNISETLRLKCTTTEQRLDALIRGVPGVFESRCDWIRRYLPWHNEPFVCVVKYDELVGNKGGGSTDTLHQAMRRIRSHIGINLHGSTLIELAENGYDPTSPTFQKGSVGRWRSIFTRELKDIFKENLGSELIELGFEKDDNW